ncbi:nuclear pore membrane glycoprotein, partial [Brachionus plicatilis]
MVRGDQQVEIFDPIAVQPEILIFAHTPNEVLYEYVLQVTGRSGSYFYQTKDISIAKVDSHGLLKVNSNRLGESKILVNDQRNFDIKSESKVMVVEPVGIFLDPCPVEALVKSRLEINVKMNGLMQDGSMVSINDCSKISFNVRIQDETVFKHIEVVAADRMGENCAKIILDAKKVGKSLIQVFYGELKSQEMKIFSFPQLTSLKKNLVLTKSSSYLFSLSDGPFLNSDIHSYVSEFRVNRHHIINVEHLEHNPLASKYTYKITCLDTNDFENEIEFTIWNRVTSQNKCPMKFNYKLGVSCLRPKILELSQLFVKNDGSDQEVYSNMKWNRPIKLNSKFAVANLNRDLNIQLLVKDS